MVVINYLLTFILAGGWAVSLINFHPGREVHMLLILAMVSMSGIFSRKETSSKIEKFDIDNA